MFKTNFTIFSQWIYSTNDLIALRDLTTDCLHPVVSYSLSSSPSLIKVCATVFFQAVLVSFRTFSEVTCAVRLQHRRHSRARPNVTPATTSSLGLASLSSPALVDNGVRKFQMTSNALRALVSNFIGPILWGHSGPLCHTLSLSLALSWTSMRR